MIYGTSDARLREGETAAMPPLDASSAADVFSTAFDAQLKAYNLNSALATKEQAFDETIDGIFELTGQRLENPMRAPWVVVENGVRVPRRSDPVLAFEQRIADLANEQPDKSRHILALRGSLERAYQKRNASVRAADDATMRSQWTGNVPLLGPVNPVGIAGGLAGAMLDPATLIVNAVGSAGQGGRILFHALRSALINAGAEVAQQPFIKQWANEAGDPYGWDDAARSVAAAALLGGALDAGIRGGYRGVQTARGLEPVRESGLITGWRSPEDKIAALDDAASRLPDDNPVRRAAEGNIAAVREIAETTGAIDDPALRGEIIAREMADGLEGPPPMNVDAGDGFARLAQALRNATDPDEPPAPAGPPPVTSKTQPDAANIPAALDEAFGLAGRILPEGTRVDVVPDMVEPISGQAVDAVAFQGNIRLSARALDPKARVGHEGVHILVQRGLLSSDEVFVLAAAARKAGAFSDDADARYRQAYANRDNLDLLIAEEAAAAFVEGRVHATPEVQGIVDRITQFFERLKNALDGRGFRSADDVSRSILSGKVARRQAIDKPSAPASVSASIDDFASSVASLKSRHGVKTRQRTFDQGSFALREDAEAIPLPQALENATGPKIPVIMSYIAKFGSDGDEITTSVKRALSLDISTAGVADLQKFIVALDEMQQIIQNRLQAGYKLADDVQSVRDKIDERFDDVIARIDEIDNEAGNYKWELMNRSDELGDRYDELLDARFGDDEAAREAYLDSLPFSDLPSVFHRLPEMQENASVLQVAEVETPVANVFVTDHISRAKRLLEADPEKMDMPEIERALDETSALIAALDGAELWAQGLSKLAEEKRAGGLDLIDGLQDEKLSPVLERLEGHTDELDGKVTEAEDLLTARQEGSAMYALSGERRRQAAAEALARTPQAATHAALLGARVDAGGARLVDVASAEAKAQSEGLERGLASAIERAQKPELRAERASSLAQIRREPSRPAKSLGESLKGVSIDAPAELFHWLGIKPARFQANYEKISAKRRERPSLGVNLSEPSAVRTFVEDVLSTAEVAIVTGDGAHWDLIARNGRDSVVGARLEMKGGRYNIETALVLDEGQLARRLAGAIRERGLDGLKWRDAEAASTILELIRRDVALREHPSAQRVITALERSQDGLADIAISEGRYLHAHPATSRMAEIRAEIDRTVKMLPRDVRLRVVDRLEFGGREANGAWDGYDRIVYASLSAVDPVRTVRHETIHALRQSGLMTDQEFDTLYAFAERAGLRQAYGIDKHYGELYGKAYADRGAAGVEALLREETIADMFADYSLNGRRFADEFGRQGRTIDKVLDLIVKFLKHVRDALHIQGFKDVRDIFDAIETGAMAARADRRVTLPGGLEIEGINLFSLKAFHGTPHTFAPEEGAPAGRFRSSEIGKGEGAQAFGHGLYFAESEEVARFYRDALAEPGDTAEGIALDRLANERGDRAAAIKKLKKFTRSMTEGQDAMTDAYIGALRLLEGGELIAPPNKGRLYEVRIDAEADQFLDWDRPLGEQALFSKVKDAIPSVDPNDRVSQAITKFDAARDANIRDQARREGRGFAWVTAQASKGDQQAYARLAQSGIAGIRYLDASSRGASDGTRNLVVFPGNEHLIEIVAVDGQPVVNLAADLADAKRETGLGKVVEACRF